MQGLVITPAQWAEQRWKNGRGVTHEIWRWRDPRSAHVDTAYDVRLSVARIDGPQDFSLFPGYERVLVPLDDSALTLGPADDATKHAPLTKHGVFAFSGDVAMATRGSGSTRDLNVMAHGPLVVAVGTSVTATGRLAIFALGAVTLRDDRGEAWELAAMDTWIDVDARATGSVTTSAPVVFARF